MREMRDAGRAEGPVEHPFGYRSLCSLCASLDFSVFDYTSLRKSSDSTGPSALPASLAPEYATSAWGGRPPFDGSMAGIGLLRMLRIV